jgi:hypothetical protein
VVLEGQVEMPQVLVDLMEVMVPTELEVPEDLKEEQSLSLIMDQELVLQISVRDL